jgi:hypothetical protein
MGHLRIIGIHALRAVQADPGDLSPYFDFDIRHFILAKLIAYFIMGMYFHALVRLATTHYTRCGRRLTIWIIVWNI